jgi:hypothetical protein
MKINRISTFLMGIIIAILAITQYGCEQKWENEFEPSELKAPATATLSVTSIEDSTAVLNYTQTVVGQLYVVVLPGDDETPAPVANSVLRLTASGAVFTKQLFLIDDADRSGSITITGLMQDTYYKVFALPVNTDGVLGEVTTTDAFATSDNYEPTLNLASGISPAISSAASQTKTFKPVLTFSEPVVLADDISIEIGYFNRVTGVVDYYDVPKDSISIASNKVTIAQPFIPLNGTYVFLSIGASSIKDRAGNYYAGITSGLEGTSLVNIYWRVKLEAITQQQILPTENLTTNVNLVITLDYPIKMRFPTTAEGGYVQANVTVKYTSGTTYSVVQVPASNVAIVQDTLVQITIPRTANFGETITFSMTEGAMRDVYGNASKAIALGAKSWLVSYGYTRDLVLGDYIIGDLVSHWDGPITDEYPVTLSAHSTDANKVVVSGLLGSDDDIVAEFNGDFASFNIPVQSSGDGQMLTFPTGHALEGNTIEVWNGYADNGVATGFINSDGTIEMAGLGFYIVGVGWYDLYPSSIWSKAAKSNVQPNYVLKNGNIKGKLVK